MPPNKNWIDKVMSECEHVETPRSWLWWSLCCSVSAAASNNYYLPVLKGAVIVKANIYTILLGESGLGKEFPIWLSTELVDKADITRVIAGRSSIQGILNEIGTFKTRPNAQPFEDSRAFVVNGELSTAVISDPDSLTILTDLYDRKTKWANLLKGDGIQPLKSPYITCLFGSSPAHFYDSIPQVNIEGGYIGRNLIVFEERRAKDTDLLTDEDSSAPEFPFDKFIPHLQNIAARNGKMSITPRAKLMFNEWRRDWRLKSERDKTGFNNRVPVHALKIAMCLCLADEQNYLTLVINEDHLEEAIDNVVTLVYANKRTTEGKGVDPLAVPTKMVIDFLLLAPENQLHKQKLLVKGYGNFDGPVLDRILDTLVEMKWIETEIVRTGRGADKLIKLTGEPLKQYKEHLKRRA